MINVWVELDIFFINHLVPLTERILRFKYVKWTYNWKSSLNIKLITDYRFIYEEFILFILEQEIFLKNIHIWFKRIENWFEINQIRLVSSFNSSLTLKNLYIPNKIGLNMRHFFGFIFQMQILFTNISLNLLETTDY